MLREYLGKLCSELDIRPAPKLNEGKFYLFRLSDEALLQLRDLEPGVAMQANICRCPERKREDLFIYLMRANLLGQGTGGSRIGMDEGEKSLTLSLGLPYEMSYQAFRENIEDFVNYLIYWREEVAKFEKEAIL
ncbi:MAG TPA: type III secretion system chaperone [Chlamydiales bacterium]|nr:type III secretion system chaperone [Chlamydiales bacterium]